MSERSAGSSHGVTAPAECPCYDAEVCISNNRNKEHIASGYTGIVGTGSGISFQNHETKNDRGIAIHGYPSQNDTSMVTDPFIAYEMVTQSHPRCPLGGTGSSAQDAKDLEGQDNVTNENNPPHRKRRRTK